MTYIWTFLIGGAFCVIAQLLTDLTDLKPVDVLVGYVVCGVILDGIGIYKPLVEFAGCGATVPLTGFGYTLAEGVKEAVNSKGLIGAFTGGLTAASAGISVAIGFALLLSLLFRSKEK